ncbi:hypothetical protein BIW11_06864 [Tropilaelaps mercedesae]|uniref:HMG box domain-containing protein n=1 Tax=Tropilaelaps mercedesae TaxID=418985 RepID=A0A1V9XW76_9ACAR|nr:hypothetical protein BIW11_06864 [Tropilaelaps mercedesae]
MSFFRVQKGLQALQISVGKNGLSALDSPAWRLLATIRQQKKEDTSPLKGPKRPPNAYFLFVSEMMPTFRTKNPELKPNEVIKQLGANWRVLSDKEREAYVKKAKEESKRYIALRDAFISTLTPEQLKEKQKMPLVKTLKRSKRELHVLEKQLEKPNVPLRSFSLFVKESHAASGKGPLDIAMLAEKWRSMADEQKKLYVTKAKESQEVYNKNLESWTKRVDQTHLQRLNDLKLSIAMLTQKLRGSK